MESAAADPPPLSDIRADIPSVPARPAHGAAHGATPGGTPGAAPGTAGDANPGTAPGAVLDTNVVLDWLLFRDPAAMPLAHAIAAGQVVWLACAHMRCELDQVAGRPGLRQRGSEPASLLAAFDRHARLLPPPVADPLLRCADPDDQVFIDLSRAHRARWLVTRDRALLTLARRAAQVGLAIVAPQLWRPAHGA